MRLKYVRVEGIVHLYGRDGGKGSRNVITWDV